MLPPFELEQYLLTHEHKASLSLCATGFESIRQSDLLSLADSECKALWEEMALGYSPPLGSCLLRAEVSKQYASVTSEQVGIFAGAAEAILCTLSGFLKATDHAVVVTPCYQSLLSVPASICNISEVPLDSASAWQLDLEKIERALKPETRMIIVNFPNNPTGALPDQATFSALIDTARRRNLYLFSDEVYRLMEVNESDRLPPVADCYERGISISSMSKAYGLPGVRIGWIATRAPKVLQAATNLKHYTSICPNATGELMALIALREKETLLERNRQVLQNNLSLMTEFFDARNNELAWMPPQGGCVSFPKLLTPETAETFALRLLHEEGVLILPGHLYGQYDRHFRISCAQRDMAQALAKLGRALDRMPVCQSD